MCNFTLGLIWNLDETGATPEKYFNGLSSICRFIGNHGCQETNIAEFRSSNRVTMISVISAPGETGPTLLVLKGRKIPYRQV